MLKTLFPSYLNSLKLKDKTGEALTLDQSDNGASYLNYMQRQKTPPAFDELDISTTENQLFGTAKIDRQHFT